ncbi:MAG TPA: hypothetical protein VLF89_04755 [Candidatus Saccharimonadales bacterium]|nr:hypothetical protein [Candidatus Saccharimonadales bacterium]
MDTLIGGRLYGINGATEEQESARRNYSEIGQIVDAISDEGLFTEFEKKQAELHKVKSEHALLLEKIAIRNLDSFVKSLNYSLILNIEDYDLPINQYRLISQDLPQIDALVHALEPAPQDSLIERYGKAEWAMDFIRKYIEKVIAQNSQEIFLPEEENIPQESEVREAVIRIASVPEIINQIEFHNDLEGFLLPNGLTEYTDTPSLLRTIASSLSIIDFNKNPLAAVSLAKKINAIQEELGELHIRTSWKDSLTIDKIYKLLEKKEMHDEKNTSLQTTIVDGAIQRYEQLIQHIPPGRLTSVEVQKEEYFITLLSSIAQESEPMLPSDERLLRSQLLALHYLFSGGGITALYTKYRKSLKYEQKQYTPEEERHIKAELAMKFLLQNEKKNKEYIFDNDPYATTIGFEYEYIEELEGILGDDLEHIDNYERAHKFLQEIYSLPESSEKEEHIKRLKTYLTDLKKLMEVRNWILINDPNAPQESLLSVFFHLRETPTMTLLISKIRVFSEDLTYGYREMITQPSNYYRLQQRELVQTLLTSHMNDTNLNMHITIGNIELSPERPEASDIRVILESADMLTQNFTDEEVDAVINKKQAIRHEAFWKCTGFYGQLYYLPYHFVRRGDEMLRYNNNYPPQGYELRSFPGSLGNAEAFSTRVRLISFVDLINKAIKSNQKSKYLQTEKDKESSCILNTFINSWKDLLQTNDIDYLPLDKRFAKVEISGTEDEQELKFSTPDLYSYFLNRVAVESKQNLGFRNQSRKLITEFSHQMRIVLGDKKSFFE